MGFTSSSSNSKMLLRNWCISINNLIISCLIIHQSQRLFSFLLLTFLHISPYLLINYNLVFLHCDATIYLDSQVFLKHDFYIMCLKHVVAYNFNIQKAQSKADRCRCIVRYMLCPFIISSRLVVWLNLISSSGSWFILPRARTRCLLIAHTSAAEL